MPINASFTKIAFVSNADCIGRASKNPADIKIKTLTKDIISTRITTVDVHTILVHSEKINEQYTSSDLKFVGVKDLSGKNLPFFKRIFFVIKRFFFSSIMIKKAASEITKNNENVTSNLAKTLAELSFKGKLGEIQEKQGNELGITKNQPEEILDDKDLDKQDFNKSTVLLKKEDENIFETKEVEQEQEQNDKLISEEDKKILEEVKKQRKQKKEKKLQEKKTEQSLKK